MNRQRLPQAFLREFRLYIVEHDDLGDEQYALGCNDDAVWVAVTPMLTRTTQDDAERLYDLVADEVGAEVYLLLHREVLTGPLRRFRICERPGAVVELTPNASGTPYARIIASWLLTGDHRWGEDLKDAINLLRHIPIRRDSTIH